MKIIIMLITSLFLTTSFANRLTKEELIYYKSNEATTITNDIKNETWPEVIIYLKINASPLECIALFLALDHQKKYLPNVLESTPVKQISALTIHTKYEYDLPWPISNTKYIHSSTLNNPSVLYDKKYSYSATWKMIESDSTEEVKGSVIFHPSIHKGQSYMKYKVFIRPSSFIAGLLKKSMISDVKASMMAFKSYLEDMSINKAEMLKGYTSKIEKALKGEYVYLPKAKVHK